MEWRNIKYEVGRHLSDSTAIVTFFNPICAAVETTLADMSDSVSVKSRLIAAGLTYGGLGNLTKVRDWSKRKLDITRETAGKIMYLHDGAFAAACVLVIRPSIYLASGETDWKKIALGTAYVTGLSALLGGPLGHFIDSYRDLTGVKESERVPELIRRQRSSTKKSLATFLAVASIAATSLVYHLTPNENIRPQQTQQVVNLETSVSESE